jgi:hypothetical protein
VGELKVVGVTMNYVLVLWQSYALSLVRFCGPDLEWS